MLGPGVYRPDPTGEITGELSVQGTGGWGWKTSRHPCRATTLEQGLLLMSISFVSWGLRTIALSVGHIRGEAGNSVDGHCKKLRVRLNANTTVSQCASSGNSRASTHEWVQNDPLSQRKGSPDNLPHEGLRLERGMRREVPLSSAGRCTPDDIAKRLFLRNATEATCFPRAQVVLDTPFTWLAKKPPRLPARSGHDRHVVKLLMRVFGPVTTPQRLYQAHDFPTLFKTCLNQCHVYDVREERVGGDKYVPSRYQYSQDTRPPTAKEVPQGFFGFMRKNCKPRQRTSGTPVQGWRYAPHATASTTQFPLFLGCILLESVRWVGYYSVNTVRRTLCHPVKTVSLVNLVERFELWCRYPSPRSCYIHCRFACFRFKRLTLGSIITERLSEKRWSLYRIPIQNVIDIYWQVISQHIEGIGIHSQGLRYPLNHAPRGSSFACFQLRHVSFSETARPSLMRPAADGQGGGKLVGPARPARRLPNAPGSVERGPESGASAAGTPAGAPPTTSLAPAGATCPDSPRSAANCRPGSAVRRRVSHGSPPTALVVGSIIARDISADDWSRDARALWAHPPPRNVAVWQSRRDRYTATTRVHGVLTMHPYLEHTPTWD